MARTKTAASNDFLEVKSKKVKMDALSSDGTSTTFARVVRGIKVPACLHWIPDSNIADGVIESNYKIASKTGCGGSACVVQAIDVNTGKHVAIKVIRHSPTAAKAFDNEATMLFNINHSGVIRFVNAAIDSKNYYLILEFAAYGDLMKIALQNGGKLSEGVVKVVLARVLDALVWLHGRNVAHRDLKPENIVFKESIGLPLLIDFAMAKKVPHDRSTLITELCGTPYYVAPEKWSIHTADALKPGDMWSIGVIAFALVTGFMPFEGKSLKQTKKCIERCEFSFFEDVVKTSDEFKSFVRALLVTDYTKRMTAKEALNHPWFSMK